MLEVELPRAPIYRIGRAPNPWSAPDWARAHSDGTFGNRFDDPQAYYRVVYGSSQRLGCFLETLGRFRPDLTLLAELDAIEGPDDFTPLATLPRSWLQGRMISSAQAEGRYADIYAAGWIAHLRRELAAAALAFGIADIDASTLERRSPRQLTQQASLVVYREGFDGVYYRSRYGHSIQNWALFEPFMLTPAAPVGIQPDDADLQTALRLHGIALEASPTPARLVPD